MQAARPLQGRTALITGASKGIGAATAIALASAGADVVIHYNRSLLEAERVLAKVSGVGGVGTLVQADLSVLAGIHRLIGTIAQIDMKIEILVNNAGSMIRRTPGLEITEEFWHRTIMLNLTSAFMVAQAILPEMVRLGRGSIVNISSIGALTGGGIGSLAYVSAKGGISAMTKGLAREFGRYGVRVNAISPGAIDTDFHRDFSDPQKLESVRAATPIGRLGTPEDIAQVVVFLCSDAAGFIDGQVLEANGGFLMI